MSKRNLIITIILITTFIVGILLFFYFKSVTQTQNIITPSAVNPFGSAAENRTFNVSTTTQGNQDLDVTKNLAKLTQIYRKPASGAIFLINKNNQNILRFVDRATGNIYEYVAESQIGEPKRLTNTTIPKIQESIWSNLGNNLVFRYLDNDTDNIISFSAEIKISTTSEGTVGEIMGTFLPSNLKQLAISPKGDKIFWLTDKSDKLGSFGSTANLNGSSKKTIFNSPISYWNISWPKEEIITFTTKPNFRDVGLLYFFNTKTLSMDRILGDITGLSTMTNKNADLVAYSYSLGDSFSLDIYDVNDRISKNFKITTLADKCVWGNKNSSILYCAVPQGIPADLYPDAWYQGLEFFIDSIWMIDTSTGATNLIYTIGSNENANIDATNLKMSADDQYLSFINKIDLSLWLLQIPQ